MWAGMCENLSRQIIVENIFTNLIACFAWLWIEFTYFHMRFQFVGFQVLLAPSWTISTRDSYVGAFFDMFLQRIVKKGSC